MIPEQKKLTKREKEVIYFILSRILDQESDEGLSQEEFNLLDTLRDKFK